MPSASVTVRLERNGTDTTTGDLTVSISGIQTSTSSEGTAYGDGPNADTAPTVRVESSDGSYQDEKQVGTFLSATFASVPVTDLRVTASHPDYVSASKSVSAADFS